MSARLMTAWLAAALTLVSAGAGAAEIYVPGTITDPRIRAAEYLDRNDRHFSAIVELLLVTGSNDPLRMPTELQSSLAANYLSFGMRDRAEGLYRHLATTAADPLEAGRAQLRVAEFEYQRGYTAEARATLARMRAALPEELQLDWQDLMARVLMSDARYGEAAEILGEGRTSRDLSPFSLYNLGVALINDGRAPQGQTVLDRVGRLVPKTVEELALRDRANLSLGWHFLQAKQGGTALPIFSRVRVEGPFSNRALLGLGWAELAPQGERIQKAQVGDENLDATPFTTFSTLGVLLRPGFSEEDIFKRAGLRAFRLKRGSKEDEENLRRALVPWVELISRDPMDAAVQEAWLAIPFTLDRLGAYTQALQYYERAIGVLETAQGRMDAAMTSIRQGRMVETIVRRELDSEAGWKWQLLDLPDAPETYFLQSLIAEHRFQEALKNYRDVRMMMRSMESWSQRLAAVEVSYASSDRPAAKPDDQVRRARTSWSAPWAGMSIRLRTDTQLSAPGTYTAPAPVMPVTLPGLQLSTPSARFNGPIERARATQKRIAGLRGQLATVAAEQAKLLQDMALVELEGQKRQIQAYLVEARFALARLYDRQLKGELNDQ